MAADAFTNPDYMRYAVKTLLACLICYTFYSGVDWEGIGTCMLTCVIVANPNVGCRTRRRRWVLAGPFARDWRCYSRYWSCPGWTILSNCCLCWPRFSCWGELITSSERSSYIGSTDGGHLPRSPRSKTFLARCTPGLKKFAIAPWVSSLVPWFVVIYTFVWA